MSWHLRIRLILFIASLLALAAPVSAGLRTMPEFGAHPLPYGEAINAIATAERHVTNMVSAVNFDYRSIDTLGEEFMLLAAVTGTVVLLRGARGERSTDRPGRVPGRRTAPRNDAVVLVCRLFSPLILVFGIYVALHAMVTPGGGFQGGCIIGSGAILLYLGEGYGGWRRLVRTRPLDALEGGGAAVFALCGLVTLFSGAAFLQNLLPLGQPGTILSGGLMVIENAGVACAVTGGFGLLLLEFMEETREMRTPE
jgi:multicomponent Na+:H+ antiporter subunit B